MNKEELLKEISDLINWDNWYSISDEYEIWNFNYKIIGNIIIITIPHRNDLRAFKTLLRDCGSKTPSFDNLDCQTSIELLFNHYPYWHTNWSNCFLIDDNNQIFWISWNWMEHNSFIKSSAIKYPWHIIINNQKKLDYNLYVEDIPKITNFLNSLSFK
jgi:hypothetical protein